MSIIDFSEEQSMLLETANEFCRKNSTISVVRAQIDKEESVDAELWSRIVEDIFLRVQGSLLPFFISSWIRSENQ